MNKKANKKPNVALMIVKYAILSVFFLVGVGVAIFGAIKRANVDFEFDKAIISCDDKDYSSYVKSETITTPGNTEINNQIEVYKNAMENAKNANDTVAYGQLNAEYQRLLSLQTQTSESLVVYDYSEADKAKENCKTLAGKQKEMDTQIATACLLVGGILAIICVAITIFFSIFDYRKYH